MPLIYWGTGWFIGIALASALHLPIEFLLAALLLPMASFFLWRHDRHMRLIWFSVGFALAGALWFTLRLPHFDQNSLSTYNGSGIVTLEGVIEADPDVRDTYINLRVNADGSTAATVQVSNVDDQAVNDATVIYDQAAQVNSINRAAG